MPKTICLTFNNFQYPIQLEQDAPNIFTVVYGYQIKCELSYCQAVLELGACIMHALACEGKLDNSGIS